MLIKIIWLQNDCKNEELIKRILKKLNLWMIPKKEPSSIKLKKEEEKLIENFLEKEKNNKRKYEQFEICDSMPNYEEFNDFIPDYDECI